MRITLTQHISKNSQRIRVLFEVRGGPEDPTAEGVLFGVGDMSFPLNRTPEEIAEAVWKEAQAIEEEGLASWRLHNQIAPLLTAMMEGQKG